MNLYTTHLVINNTLFPYEVYREGDRLFFKPLNPSTAIDAPLFWVHKVSGEWKPININDEDFIKEIQNDIAEHHSDIETKS